MCVCVCVWGGGGGGGGGLLQKRSGVGAWGGGGGRDLRVTPAVSNSKTAGKTRRTSVVSFEVTALLVNPV